MIDPRCADESPHQPHGVCPGRDDADWCWFHYAREPVDPEVGSFLICGECFHLYATADELIDAWAEMALRVGIEGPPPRDAAAILFCPYCAHDF